MSRITFVAFALLPSSLAAQPASQLILCSIRGGETFEVEIGAPSEFGPLNCFHAPGIYDMTPCAPNGGWGLSYRSGSASLAEVTMHGMGISHMGGMFWSSLQPTQILAAAAYGEQTPFGVEITGDTYWSIVIDRMTGEAVIQTEEGAQAATCRAQQRQF